MIDRARATWSSWTSGLDGRLLTDAAWRRRHLVVATLATANGIAAMVLGINATHGSGLWIQGAALALALTAAWHPGLDRRPRELAIVVAFLLCASVQNRYGANFSSLSAAYVLLIAVYQDWLPLAAALLGILVLPIVAIASPDSLEQWKAFQEETPRTGSFVRTFGVYVAAGVAVLIWRANGVAARDRLTGLATREHAERRLSQALRNGRHAAVLVGDVDAFRLAADELPRASSDGLIRDVGRRLHAVLAPRDEILAAGGGATYILVRLADTSPEEAEQMARRWCEAVSREPFEVESSRVPVSISVGFAPGSPQDEPSDLLRAAEIAMRRAKWRGDPAIAMADEALLEPRVRPETPITAELRQALEQDELVMHYQPLVDMASGTIVGAEALVRWEHPTRGLVPPGSFLPAAETHPWLSAQISNTIGSAVLRQLAEWDSKLPGCLPMGVAINLSPTRLKDPTLRESMSTALDAAGVDPARVIIELTEGGLMDLDIDAAAALTELAGLDVRIALDDFGTGHSSLSRLRDFPLDEIKIDRSFVPGVLNAGPDRGVVAAVLAIARGFGSTVVVEGIETEEERQAILAMQHDVIAQGFHFARPMPAAELTALLRHGRPLPLPSP